MTQERYKVFTAYIVGLVVGATIAIFAMQAISGGALL